MGLYLKNSYNTPIGFYAYPLIDESISSFAVERPFMIIVKPKPEARLLDLSRYTEEQLKQDGEKLKTAGFDPNVVDEAQQKKQKTSGICLGNLLVSLVRRFGISQGFYLERRLEKTKMVMM